jgi:DNA-binding NarL/FixJ family response regulator
MNPIQVLIADDHPVFRHGMRAVLEAAPDTVVVGEATTGDEAITLAEQLRPDVIMMDLQMPHLNGIDATRRLRQVNPDAHVLVVTMFEDDSSVFAAMRAGARGYVLKDATKDEILRAIRAVAHGEAIFSPAIANRLITFFANSQAHTPPDLFPELTGREREILELIAQGHNNSEIAKRLDLSVKTVSNYVSNIFNKLQVADRAAAIIRARDAGLGVGGGQG